jgi:hypothetical protein
VVADEDVVPRAAEHGGEAVVVARVAERVVAVPAVDGVEPA